MIKAKYTLLFLLISSTLFSCNKYLATKMKPTEITELEVFRPVTFIAQIENKNIGVLSDQLSHDIEKMLVEETFSLSTQMPQLSPVIIKDEETQFRLENEILQVCLKTSKLNAIHVMPIPPTVDKVLESKGKRFGLVIFSNGYLRTEENYKWAKKNVLEKNIFSIAGALMSNIAANATPIPNNGSFLNGFEIITIYGAERTKIDLYVAILDAKNNNISFFNESIYHNKKIMDNQIVREKLTQMFSKYFIKKGTK